MCQAVVLIFEFLAELQEYQVPPAFFEHSGIFKIAFPGTQAFFVNLDDVWQGAADLVRDQDLQKRRAAGRKFAGVLVIRIRHPDHGDQVGGTGQFSQAYRGRGLGCFFLRRQRHCQHVISWAY